MNNYYYLAKDCEKNDDSYETKRKDSSYETEYLRPERENVV